MKIATLNAMLIANAAGFVAGCHQAEHAASDMHEHIEGISRKLEAVAGAIGLEMSASALVEFVHSSMETIETANHMAEVLGISANAFQKLSYAAKLSHVDTETMSGGLTKLLKNMNEAATGGGPAAAAFQKLGVSAAELTKLPADQALAKIADGFKGVENPAERVHVAMDLFGKSGAQMLPMLEQGSEGLSRMGDEAQKLGVALSDQDNSKVVEAGEAMKRVGAEIEGIGNKLTVALAPYIEGVCEQLVDMMGDGTGATDAITDGVERVAEGIAQASGTIDLFEAAWDTLKGVVIGVAAGIIRIIDDIGSGIVKLLNKIPGVNVAWEGMGDVADGMAAQAQDAFDSAGKHFDDMANGKRAQGVRDFFQGVKDHAAAAAAANKHVAAGIGETADEAAKASAKIDQQIDKLRESLATFGKTASEKLRIDLKAQGASDAQIEAATAMQDQLDKLGEAAKYHEANKTAAEKYADELKHIAELANTINPATGKAYLSADDAARAQAKAQKDMDDSQGKDKDKPKDKDRETGPAKLLQAGSQEAAAFLTSFQRQGQGDAKDGEVKKTNKKLDTQTDYLKRMYDLANSGGATPLTFANVA